MTTIKLNATDVAVTKRALSLGYFQHIIAGYFKTNQGRVSEISRGKRWAGIAPADHLPPDFPALA